MTKVLVPLAQGCEELEAVTVTDLLTRAGIEVVTAGLDSEPVVAARGLKIIPQTIINNVTDTLFDMIVLPGGLPGANHLRDNDALQNILKKHAENNNYLAAICAAPKALLQAGVLEGKTITCYPGALNSLDLSNIKLTESALQIDGKIVTSRGPGTAMDFALALIELLEGTSKKEEVEKGLVR
ncbi:MAG: DJ-1 family protein [endosymbiont of Galathealinum brachiosum]|uniref:DJ-1 family protein n=1 Tax=endosymbiont of Galathealinum brachiosum TaxID=2200906 RepID=A0A370DE16_9GAMM|nr:MAG: DJ-1 family protein [endosymbiont of Galathealinum brachiosum]